MTQDEFNALQEGDVIQCSDGQGTYEIVFCRDCSVTAIENVFVLNLGVWTRQGSPLKPSLCNVSVGDTLQHIAGDEDINVVYVDYHYKSIFAVREFEISLAECIEWEVVS